LGTGTTYAADYTWDNGSVSDNNWSTPENWNPDGTPGAGDNVIFDATSNTGCIADNVNDNLASISLNSGYTSTLTVNANFVGGTSNELTLTGDLTVNSGTVLCNGDTSTTNGTGIVINAANMTVGEDGLVSANGQGFAPNQGPGKGIRGVGNRGSGGGYGGNGGKDIDGDAGGLPYGTASAPTSL
jgi:predicted secreted protein